MIRLALVLSFLLTALIGCGEDAPTQQPVRIMLVGDSVTQGSSGDWTWRYRLWEHLEGLEVDSDFVGPDEQVAGPPPGEPNLDYADPDFDRDHAARWGKSFLDEDRPIADLVETYHPEVVVELLGINDTVWRGLPTPQLVEEARGFVADVQAADPSVDVVLGALPQIWYDGVSAYNVALDDVAAELTTAQSEVVVARPVLPYVKDVDTYDPLHPSATGELRIAAGMANALAEIGIGSPYARSLPVVAPVPTSPAVLSGAPAWDPSAVDLSWTPPPGGWTAYVWRRDVTRGEEWLRLPLGLAGTTWTAEGLIAGDVYEFRLQMAKGTSESEVFSNVVSVTPGSSG